MNRRQRKARARERKAGGTRAADANRTSAGFAAGRGRTPDQGSAKVHGDKYEVLIPRGNPAREPSL